MWYVIQTTVGNERKLVADIESMVDGSVYNKCFVITVESMRRREGRQILYEEILFTGYIFVDTDTPTDFYERLKGIQGFTKLLSEESKVDDNSFLWVSEEEQVFLESIIDDSYTVRLSLVKKNKNNKVIALAGPLLVHQEQIIDVDFRHRRAFISISLLGEEKRVKLGICTEQDLVVNDMRHRLDEIRKSEDRGENPYESIDKWDWKNRKKYEETRNTERMKQNDMLLEVDGIAVGMKIKVNNDLYRDKVFIVKKVNMNKRTVIVDMEIFGTVVAVELGVNEVLPEWRF